MPIRSSHSLFRQTLRLAFLFSVLWSLNACHDPPRQVSDPARIPVVSEKVAPAAFQPALRLWGEAAPSDRMPLTTSSEGRIRYAPRFAAGLRTGETVSAGEALFQVESEKLQLASAEAKLLLSGAETELDRARRGVEGGVMSAADLERAEIEAQLAKRRLESAQNDLAQARQTAPRAGVLQVDEPLAPGTRVTAGQIVAELAGAGSSRIEAWAASSDRARLAPDLTVECLAPGTSDVIGRGRISEIAGRVDASGAVRLIVSVDEDLGMPPPGEGVDLRVQLPTREAALTVPEQAVLAEGAAAAVFVLKPRGAQYQVSLRPVQVGSRSDGRAEILDGLREGELVAVEGAEFLADGLTAVEAKTEEEKTEEPKTEEPKTEESKKSEEGS